MGCEGAGHDAMLRPRPFGGLAVLQAFAMPLNCLVHEPFTGVRHGVASFAHLVDTGTRLLQHRANRHRVDGGERMPSTPRVM